MITTAIVFTRYPEPGKTKTRLIPALGAEGAAQLQQQLTEHTLAQVTTWQQQTVVAVEIHFTGGSQVQMQDWLGQRNYISQAQGGLGERLQRAIAPHFPNPPAQVLVMGIDCPGLDAKILSQATNALAHHDLVLGPAQDGGYYLIGLRQYHPRLFEEIDWSTDRVFKQTCDRAQELDFSLTTLPMLRDVDYPEDLEVWQAIQEAAQRG